MGVDEAGRGSLVGELVVVAIAIPAENAEELKAAGVKDSKELSPARRRELYGFLKGFPFFAVPISPREIDRYNINVLEERAIIRALKGLKGIVGPSFSTSRIVIDKFGQPRMLRQELRDMGFRGELVVTAGADESYVEVAAASIVAKYLRDARIRVLSSLYGIEGSGYPHDHKTLEWLRRTIASGKKPEIIRYSWSTLELFGIKVPKKGESSRKTLDEFM
ncbi:MAG: ribonuclease HII [Acidilobaceae archaeon]|nr:ribonuclease HII [Acidilobaceae archaeon]